MALPGLGTMRFGLRSKSVEKVEDKTKRWIYEHNDVLQRLYPSYDQMEYAYSFGVCPKCFLNWRVKKKNRQVVVF